eukprot:gene6227-7756_t
MKTSTKLYSPIKNGLKKVMVISGPTGIGKSDLAIEVAKRVNGEIICADTVQIYKKLKIGSNQVTDKQLESAPHHLFNRVDFNDNYNVKMFCDDASSKIDEISNRGAVPILVGGAGFYLNSLMNGLTEELLSDEDKIKIKLLDIELRKKNDWLSSIKILHQYDPKSANAIAVNDYYRLSKSLYVNIEKGIQFSKRLDDLNDFQRSYDFRGFYLTTNRTLLMDILNLRCEYMVYHGIINETYSLLLEGLSPFSVAGRSIGYKETIQLLLTPIEKTITQIDIEEYLKEFQSNSRAYSRRQFSLFKRISDIHWLNINPLPSLAYKLMEIEKRDNYYSQIKSPKNQNTEPTIETIIKRYNYGLDEFHSVRDLKEEEILKGMANNHRYKVNNHIITSNSMEIMDIVDIVTKLRSKLYQTKPDLFKLDITNTTTPPLPLNISNAFSNPTFANIFSNSSSSFKSTVSSIS